MPDCPCVDEDDKEMSDYLVTIYQFIKPLTTKKRNRGKYLLSMKCYIITGL